MDRWKDEKGATLVMVAVAMVVLLGMVALAVDVGMMMTARTEAQRAADAAALAAAGEAFIGAVEDPQETARATAALYANKHEVLNDSVDIDPAVDVTFPGTDSVRVRVRRTSGSPDGPMETIFARILGFSTVNVSADATARAVGTGEVECALPLVVQDRWDEDPTTPGIQAPDPDTDTFDPETDEDDNIPDRYAPANGEYSNPTGFGAQANDKGRQFFIKTNTAAGGGGTYNPSWWGAWVISGTGGASYREAISDCADADFIFTIGETVEVDTEPGNMVGPTNQGFQDLVDKDPFISWDGGIDLEGTDLGDPNCAVRSGDCTTQSPRFRPIALVSPNEVLNMGGGRKSFTIANFAGFFVEDIDGSPCQQGWCGRFSEIQGVAGGTGSGNPTSDFLKAVQLVE